MVYLITMPRTSTAQGLSPKGLALELWLKSNKIEFYVSECVLGIGYFGIFYFYCDWENHKCLITRS
jgi:hypothetical protein